MDRIFIRLIDAQARWAKPLGEFNHRWLSALFGPIRPVKDALNGRWLGHPLHAVLTDAPIGILFVAIVLDLVGQGPAADIAVVLGILSIVAAAAAGLADYTDTDGTPRNVATVHATVMVGALLLYLVDLGLRIASQGSPDRSAAVVVGIVAFAVLAAGAFVGGDVVYRLGNMVDRHAWRGAGTKWLPLQVPAGELPEGTLVKAKAGINALVVVRQGETVLALHDQCAHAGGPLSDGRIVGESVECPWHGSRFRLADGRAVRGPTVYSQPAYEVRSVDGGGWEVRRRAD